MAASVRYLGQKVLASVGRAHCMHCGLTNYHVVGCPAMLQLAQQIPQRTPCPDPECATTTDEHKEGCALDMSADSMHRPRLPGLEPGRF